MNNAESFKCMMSKLLLFGMPLPFNRYKANKQLLTLPALKCRPYNGLAYKSMCQLDLYQELYRYIGLYVVRSGYIHLLCVWALSLLSL